MNLSSDECLPQKCVPAHIVSDLECLEEYLPTRKLFSTVIFQYFSRQSNVYSYALDLMFYSKDFLKGRTCSLSQAVIESLIQWSKQNDTSNQLTVELKCLAVERALQQPNGPFVQLICRAFKVEEDYNYFKLVARNLLYELKFKEAFYIINHLGAENEFSLEEFVFPAFFLDKEVWVKVFLQKTVHLRLKFVQTLDSLCRSSEAIKDFIRSLPYENLPVRKHASDTTRLQKLLSNYTDLFNIDLKECKNLYQIRCESAVNYLVRKRYKEESISQEAFEEMIKCIVDENRELQKALLLKVMCYSDTDTALKFARDFNLNRNDWPDILQTVAFTCDLQSVNFLTNKNSTVTCTACYLELRLNISDVHFIDTPEKFEEAILDISENYNVVGMDAEWRPNLGIMKENLSIYQLAVWDSVYLIDILALKKYPHQEFWISFVDNILNNKSILKLGYGIKTDVHLLMSECLGDKRGLLKNNEIVDLCEFFKKVRTCYPELMGKLECAPGPNCCHPVPPKGLSQLCYIILGRGLKKEEQFSDWERRPLRESQVIYAALDAFCLLLLYEKLFHATRALNLNLEEVLRKVNYSPAEKEGNSKKEKKQLKKKILQKPIPVSEFKVVVDNMIHGVGKYLRICGADVIFVGNEEDHMRAIQIAQAENRVILTSGSPYHKMSGYMPENMCFNVPVEENAREQATLVLKHFNVQCKESDIFSRCSVCSGKIYKRISNQNMFSLWSSVVNSDSAVETQSCIPVQERFLSEDGVLESGVPIQLSVLSPKVFETVDHFFICTNCGKVYWEGSHFSRVKKHISQFIEFQTSEQNVYQHLESAAECSQQIPQVESQNDSLKPGSDSTLTSSPPAVGSHKTYMSFEVNSSDEDDDDATDIVFCG